MNLGLVSHRRGLSSAILAGAMVLPCCAAWGTDPEFVGVLAIAVEDEVSQRLDLSDAARRQLIDLIDEREADAVDLAMSIRDLPSVAQAKQLIPFRKESERMGLALLTAEQRSTLEAIRIHRAGLQSLADPGVATKMQLTSEQQANVTRLLAERDEATRNTNRNAAERINKNFERQLKSVLTPEQIAAWNTFAAAAQTKRPFPDATEGTSLPSPAASYPAANADGKLRFSFRFAPWAEVIAWFAEQSGLSLLMDAPPQGTFNYSDPREYAPAQALDVLNSVLLTKGYTLVRRAQMLMVVNLEDGVPPNLITEVPIDELDELGEYELARCLFDLQSIKASDAADEISNLVGPQGRVNVLTSSNQLSITETGGRLRTFRQILAASEKKNATALGSATLIKLSHVRADDVLEMWRKLMGLAEEDNATVDGSLRVSRGKTSRQLVVTGDAHRIQDFKRLAELLDSSPGPGSALAAPQLEVYPVTEADPASVLQVLETLLEDADEMRLASDPKTGSLVALATAGEHATIRATIEQMQQDRREVEVIRLRTVDPQLAMLSIEKLFAPPDGEERVNSKAPRVDADPISRSLLIRGSQAQIEDIKTLLAKMGEREPDENDRSLTSGRGNLRMIPIDAATARRAMEQLNSIWPTIRKNRIRSVAPSSSIRGLRPGKEVTPTPDPERSDDLEDRTTTLASRSLYVIVQDNRPNEIGSEQSAQDGSESSPEIVVTLGDQGLLVASDDIAALDEFEALFNTLANSLFSGSRELGIFYLKYAKADVAAEMLKQFMGGGSSGGGGGTLLGNLASAALGGGGGGGIIGSLLGGGGGSSSSARISGGSTVIADPRLNAVVVQATPKELDFIENLLRALDASSSPEQIETIPAPRAIPVIHTDAEEIAEIVRSVYATRLSGPLQQPRQPSPEEFIRAMAGQKNAGRTIKDAVSEQVQLTIGVDQRRNALLVVAPDSLFLEIKKLVAQIDVPLPELNETIRYGTASGSSPETIRSALTTIIGDTIVSTDNPSDQKPTAPAPATSPESNRPSVEEIKRRMEFLKAIQQANAKAAAARKKQAFSGKK